MTRTRLIGVLVIVLSAGCASTRPLQQLVPHHVYDIVWDCTATIGCWGEVVRIDRVHRSGWVDVTYCGVLPTGEVNCGHGEQWVLNLQQALSIRLHPAPSRMRTPGGVRADGASK